MRGQQGYGWHKGPPRGYQGNWKAVRGDWGLSGGVSGVLGAGRKCSYSEAIRGIGGIRRCRGCQGTLDGVGGALEVAGGLGA